MSGSRANIVPMPRAPAPTAPPQGQMTPTPASPWPMNPIYPIPPVPLWAQSGGMPAGCCPPGGMDALLQCYCDVQSATAFISKVVQDLAANDPAFQQSLVDAIAASGSNIPLLGVTNGVDAQPGQVGEFTQFSATIAYTTGTAQTVTTSMGVLQPGDWDVWLFAEATTFMTEVSMALTPQPAGFTGNCYTIDFAPTGATAATAVSTVERALISVPTLIPVQTTLASTSAGNLGLFFKARRAR